jgi:hemolysin III
MSEWGYNRHEIPADGVVHALGVVCGLAGVTVLLILAASTAGPWELTSVLVYAGCLLAVIVIAAAYNLWPVSPVKWTLRRFDHSATYLLIAGTYTPFINQMRNDVTAALLLAGVWVGAVTGMTLKLCLPGMFDQLAILLYLLIGWSGAIAYEVRIVSRGVV